MPLQTLEPWLGRVRFASADQRDYTTLVEFVATRIGRTPKEGETFDEQGCRFEILDLDGTRVDKF